MSCDFQGLQWPIRRCQISSNNQFRVTLQHGGLQVIHFPTKSNFNFPFCSSSLLTQTTLHNNFPDWKCLVATFTTFGIIRAEYVDGLNTYDSGKQLSIRCLSLRVFTALCMCISAIHHYTLYTLKITCKVTTLRTLYLCNQLGQH